MFVCIYIYTYACFFIYIHYTSTPIIAPRRHIYTRQAAKNTVAHIGEVVPLELPWPTPMLGLSCARKPIPEGPSTQYLRYLTSTAILDMVLEPEISSIEYLDLRGMMLDCGTLKPELYEAQHTECVRGSSYHAYSQDHNDDSCLLSLGCCQGA